ncbi:kinase-like protein [Hypoxylon fragiforme]|uniref:kinase-like protein n=1 Tax=Hypoxylon fragiforme TaxID=63214 RepID=UPI0020C5C922|nr:kinase-like protein [Hypoxylon fragiforme]KAI2612116.1 kinase-like protein [Hypoxylon fragiforme]
MAHQIAQISCWVDVDQPEGSNPPGFSVNASPGDKASRRNSQQFIDFPLFVGKVVSVGRDHHENDISINHPYISRKHLVIYSVVYDPEDTQNQPPLLYVRDCQSLGGTYVDEKCIGKRENGISSGFYLSRDVVITIKPYWKFRVSLLQDTEFKTPLTAIQLKESSLFSDRYIITNRVLGSGAYASVHLAVDAKTGKQLACKIHDFDRLRRFPHAQDLIRHVIHETDLLGKLRHYNLPTFEYAFRSKHSLYTFSELATGGDLFSMRAVHGAFLEKNCKFIIQQIVNAVRYLHKGSVAHRDLKPENIFFATGPDIKSRVIVGDLGFARSTASGRMASRVGTNEYMAPEIELSYVHDIAVDMWSLGMIALFLLIPVGKFAPSSRVRVSQVAIDQWLNIVFEDLPHQRLSTPCRDFIRSCLMFEPESRLKAAEAKRHPWFRQEPDRGEFKVLVQETVEGSETVVLATRPPQRGQIREGTNALIQARRITKSLVTLP